MSTVITLSCVLSPRGRGEKDHSPHPISWWVFSLDYEEDGLPLRTARSASAHWACWLFIASIFFSSSAFSAARLKLAPSCIGGYSRKVWAYFPTSCCTKVKRQISYANQL